VSVVLQRDVAESFAGGDNVDGQDCVLPGFFFSGFAGFVFSLTGFRFAGVAFLRFKQVLLLVFGFCLQFGGFSFRFGFGFRGSFGGCFRGGFGSCFFLVAVAQSIADLLEKTFLFFCHDNLLIWL